MDRCEAHKFNDTLVVGWASRTWDVDLILSSPRRVIDLIRLSYCGRYNALSGISWDFDYPGTHDYGIQLGPIHIELTFRSRTCGDT